MITALKILALLFGVVISMVGAVFAIVLIVRTVRNLTRGK